MRRESEMPRLGIIGLISLVLGFALIGVIKNFSLYPDSRNIIYLACFIYVLIVGALTLILYTEVYSKLKIQRLYENEEKGYRGIFKRKINRKNNFEIDKDYCPFCKIEIGPKWKICHNCGKDLNQIIITPNKKQKLLALFLISSISIWFLIISINLIENLDYDKGTIVVNQLIDECNSEITEYKRILLLYNQEIDKLYDTIYNIQTNSNSTYEDIEETLIQYDKASKDCYDKLTLIQYQMDFHLTSAMEKLDEANKIPMQDWQKDIIELKLQSIEITMKRLKVYNEAICNEVFVYRKGWLILGNIQGHIIKTTPYDYITINPTPHMVPFYKRSIEEDRVEYLNSLNSIYKLNKLIKLNSINDILIVIKCNLENNQRYVKYLEEIEYLNYKKSNELIEEIKQYKCQDYNFPIVYEELNEWYKLNSENNYKLSNNLYSESEKLWWESERIRIEKKFSKS